MEYKKYQHIERLGTAEVDGILDGRCFVFPKIDGANATIWANDAGEPQFGSRNKHLVDHDNQGFVAAMTEQMDMWVEFFTQYPRLRLYGEWLVPHSLKTYRDNAWRKFYVFDVTELQQDGTEKYLTYPQYQMIMEAYDIDYIPCMAIMDDGNKDSVMKLLDINTYLIQDGKGVGEGVVIKNYNFTNKYGRVTWAKVVTNEFKEKNTNEFGPREIQPAIRIESKVVDEFCTGPFIYKTRFKVAVDNDGWSSKLIPKFLGILYHDFVTENIWEIVKKYKNPEIDFKILHKKVVAKAKEKFPEFF